MSEQLTDQMLVEKVQNGDQKAFNLLVIRYQHKVASLISRYVPQGDVPDVSQEAFIKAYRAIGSFRGDSAFYTWLYRIAVNTAKNYLVAQGRRPPSNDLDASDVENFESPNALKEISNPENLMLSEELRRVVFHTIESLPEDLRVAITLRELDGLSYEEIAVIMDCPVGTVRSRIFRAREAIDNKVQPLIQEF
ncbi:MULTISPECIES: RNA polymerase sigma factor RpoE [Enterobacterales]|jgi:RNA polymerase sigma-70 factor, ECF subfamily|uniref:ECF RNA polymerase sigma-E factor n=7 Tax=Proteus TaxID=583 RepID=A0A6G6SW83_9GAMM|nr:MULTISPECIES: RNA polymerase sigma factor RpoE [Enterobacterales]EEG86207.1 RNA polymerase sigma factor RpoE [Proteus penneri ATCC 35198]MBG2711972.1 RNA polymerase sigma factor RpoE [Proteus mirabilis]MDO5405649.1 RNA polymerase sigma factor RpoE [Proteus sp. (in: enterobacteria)]WOO48753.1 RNA polymerase sigma factor RpoE [Hafnia alvei]ATM99923.1 RNA polymerase sigma factor RpoE [Proteus vulgaris]